MRLTTTVVVLALTFCLLPACSSTDTDPDSDTNLAGAAYTILDAPFAVPSALGAEFSSVSYNYSPAPHGGDGWAYWGSRSHSFSRHMTNICDNIMYNFFNTNTRFAPYDNWGDSFQKDMTQLLKTLDTNLYRYDWDNAYIN